MMKTFKTRKFRYLYVLPSFLIFSTVLLAILQRSNVYEVGKSQQKNRRLLEVVGEEDEAECIPSGIHSFPDDFFTQEQRQKGGVLVHLFIVLYACAVIEAVCDKYFIPSLDKISEKLNLPPDVAGATFMAIGASSPELFSSILGSFVTEGDIGVGAVIGSAVFNILGITGVAGVFLWKQVLQIDWYPLARDCIAYGITVICLTWIISDNIVNWWEAVILLGLFVLYILLMYFNDRVEKGARALNVKCVDCCSKEKEEKSPLLKTESESDVKKRKISSDSTHIDMKNDKTITQKSSSQVDDEPIEENESLCTPPSGGGCWSFTWWLLMLPASVLLFLTIPNNTKFPKLFAITFFMSIAWLGVLSYIAVWMVTIIGYTLRIPDSVSGLTILAVGASVPDLVSSVLVAKSGEGNMAISNLVGSNTFDISICLGIPWLAKALLSENGYLKIQSSALAYAAGTLIVTLIVFYLIFLFSKWRLNRTVGFICLLIYAIFILFACLFEFNVFGEINIPTCYP